MEQTDSLQDIMYTVTGPDTRVKVSSEHKGLEEACRRRDRRAAHDAMDTSHGAKRAQRAGMEHMPINSARQGGGGGPLPFSHTEAGVGMEWGVEWVGDEGMDGCEAQTEQSAHPCPRPRSGGTG